MRGTPDRGSRPADGIEIKRDLGNGSHAYIVRAGGGAYTRSGYASHAYAAAASEAHAKELGYGFKAPADPAKSTGVSEQQAKDFAQALQTR